MNKRGRRTVPRSYFGLGRLHERVRVGGADAPDLVAAHKWFNLAAMHANQQASALRVEIAAELPENEIAAAQRAARDWLANQ